MKLTLTFKNHGTNTLERFEKDFSRATLTQVQGNCLVATWEEPSKETILGAMMLFLFKGAVKIHAEQ